MTRKNGFTLIEILVSVTIIAILTVIGVVSYTALTKRSRDAKRKSDLEQVRSALDMYRSDNGFYPPTSTTFDTLDTLSNSLVPTYAPSIPTDPKSTSTNTIPYYFEVIGTPPNFYSYCICAELESESGKNECGVTPISNCNYYLRNP